MISKEKSVIYKRALVINGREVDGQSSRNDHEETMSHVCFDLTNNFIRAVPEFYLRESSTHRLFFFGLLIATLSYRSFGYFFHCNRLPPSLFSFSFSVTWFFLDMS